MAVSYENLSSAENPRRGADVPDVHDVVERPIDLDATLPPTPVRDLLAESGATLYVLSADADLVATVRRAAAQHPLFVVETWEDLLEAVESGRCGIALIDAVAFGSHVSAYVTALASYADRLVTLVAADRAAAHEYVGFLSNGRIHRLLIKPSAVGAVRLLIESATARRFQLSEQSANDDARHDAAPAAPSRFPRWAWAAAVAVGAVSLVGAAIVAGRLGLWDGSTAVEVAAPAAQPTPADRIADHRAGALLAQQEGRLAEPVGDNALDHYLAILALAPTDEGARNGLSSVVATLFTRAEEALLTSSLEEAAAALDHVRRADPASSRLAFLEAQLARALEPIAAPLQAASEVSEPPAAAEPSELDSVLSLATARLRRGQLLTPAGDSARAYLDRAAALAPGDARVTALRADLAAALIAAARLVSDADVEAATNLAGEARRLGAESAALGAFDRDLNAARARIEQQQLTERLDTARERVESGTLFTPASDNAVDRLLSLEADAPELAGLAEVWESFRQAAVPAIQSTIDSGDWAAALAALERFAQVPGGAAAASPLQAELTARRLQERYLATAAPASELDLRSTVPVVYPPQAVGRGIEGWVDLEFVVDRDGQPQNLVVVRATPPGRFDAAALAAVSQYRYVPFERDGRVYERRLRLRVRFEM